VELQGLHSDKVVIKIADQTGQLCGQFTLRFSALHWMKFFWQEK